MDELDQLELKNPFALPSDEEVFRMRDEERRRKLQVCGSLARWPLLRHSCAKAPDTEIFLL